MKPSVIVPALNPSEQLVYIVKKCIKLGLNQIIVINDGSSQEYQHTFDILIKIGVLVIHHSANRGKGAALKSGIQAVSKYFPDTTSIITADADGQHSPEDILKVAQAAASYPDALILGVRNLSCKNIPFRSRFGNSFTSKVFFLMTGVHCKDTQTGLRGFSKPLFDMAISISGDRYDYEMNMLVESAIRKIPIHMIPIQTIYLDNNSSSHFRVLRDSALIYQQLLKYLAVALSSFILDIGFFSFFSHFIKRTRSGISIVTILARCISGAYNFRMNQIWSFQVKKQSFTQLKRYFLLFVLVMLGSAAIVSLLKFLPFPLPIIKVAVDAVLFIVNYHVQRRWVFAE